MKVQPINLADTFAVLRPNQRVRPVKVTSSLYQELDDSFSGFAGHVLISMHEFSEDWTSWEKHPAGDEIVMLLSGAVTLVLRSDSGDDSITLTEPGTYVIVPRNTWHTARVSQRAQALFITPGEGTENRQEPEGVA